MPARTQRNARIATKDETGASNGYLVPLYNVHDGFFPPGEEPRQVYLTVIAPGHRKGPHLHRIRTGCFTCIKGDVKIVLKAANGYEEHFSGEHHHYLSVIVPASTPALLINVGQEEAFVLNMPQPAWTPTMNDEHTADFSDYAG